jgi:hypothetical protein
MTVLSSGARRSAKCSPTGTTPHRSERCLTTSGPVDHDEGGGGLGLGWSPWRERAEPQGQLSSSDLSPWEGGAAFVWVLHDGGADFLPGLMPVPTRVSATITRAIRRYTTQLGTPRKCAKSNSVHLPFPFPFPFPIPSPVSGLSRIDDKGERPWSSGAPGVAADGSIFVFGGAGLYGAASLCPHRSRAEVAAMRKATP